ncbi:MAG: outer membrane protein OmpA-like peptidoglycan-associated protein [Chthoniobacter sp.]|jgi:outer membrane protein OmpA-like peptidoglycan-associated protein|nr:outer membrane protein OmpA-like peptidoglycan-associated protein [Chthoniobacter sp.]
MRVIFRPAMSRYDIYQSNAVEAPLMRKWVLRAFVLSLMIHGGLFAFFQIKKLEGFAAPTERPAPPRVFNMKKWNIPEAPKEEEIRVKIDKVPNAAKIPVPTDKPEVQEVRAAPQLPDMPKPILSERPKPELSGSEAFAKIEAESRGSREKEWDSIAGSLLKEGPRSRNQPVLALPKTNRLGDGGIGDAEGVPGMQSIDDALERTGPLPVGDKVGIPGGALYEYNSAELRPESIEELKKLGELIKRNPKATFSIEGHSDSFGGAEYNLRLSERRAEVVKEWLQAVMGIAPERIQTKGLGSARLIVSPDKSIEEQAPNRRVEIVIKTNRK